MSSAPIFFQFETQESAHLAQDMLDELGYRVSFHQEAQPILHVIVDRHDLTSALEIVQAYGGLIVEHEGSPGETSAYAMAYNQEDLIAIPAHFIGEEQEDGEPDLSSSEYVNKSSGAYNDANPPFDPSGNDYNGFDPGVHL
ncbi:hypothetical protein ACFQI7_28535 [Paenibacillus allorhizosphaerae]|uniref:General stress protein 17M-like domain-containing protein n=1 Tax=Paenibacillus allorhizosphaerae TaxID=2849866 RepID=A0ABM8VMI3_9BACL|nr:hypothetical protein [Paenibacillus allorhizosphaerae]CAG7649924.1 hypothetical protein PAECIP111802_04592 [Paenibacillus allorhizosphaerae]